MGFSDPFPPDGLLRKQIQMLIIMKEQQQILADLEVEKLQLNEANPPMNALVLPPLKDNSEVKAPRGRG